MATYILVAILDLAAILHAFDDFPFLDIFTANNNENKLSISLYPELSINCVFLFFSWIQK